MIIIPFCRELEKGVFILDTNVDLITDDNLKKTGVDFSAPVFLVCCNTAY